MALHIGHATVRPRYDYYDHLFSSTFDSLKYEIPVIVKNMNIMNITPELESLLRFHTTHFISKLLAKLTGCGFYGSAFDMANQRKVIIEQFFKTARAVYGIKSYDGVTAKEFSELFSRYETSLLKDCMIRSQMLDASSPIPMSLKREFTLEVKTDITELLAPEVDGEVWDKVKSNATPEVSDTVEFMNISPELENLYRIHKTARVFDGIKLHDGVTAKEFSELFSRDEESLLEDCIIRSQMLDLKREFTLEVKTDAYESFVDRFIKKRAGSTGYRCIQSLVDRFIEKNIHTIGDDQVKLDQYGMPRLQAFITLKFFEMAEEYGLKLVMDDTNIIDMLKHFEKPLLRDCIQEIQKGPIHKELIKTFAEPETGISFMQEISLDCAKQGAAVVVSHVLSSSKSRVVQDVMMFALPMGISCLMLAHLLRRLEAVSKALTRIGLMGIASSVILSFAALFPHVIMSCTFGTVAILLLAFTVMMK